MSSKVERLAAMIDDKTLISALIRERSERVRLIEFKDARADIWQYFRLVQLDGETLSYAVCVRCLKPVSYKAREGTGGLHRHPCSKAAAADSFAVSPGSALPSSLPRKESEKRVASSSRATTVTIRPSPTDALSHPLPMIKGSKGPHLDPLQAPLIPNMSLASLINARLATDLVNNIPRFVANNNVTRNRDPEASSSTSADAAVSVEDQLFGCKVIELFTKALIPLDISSGNIVFSVANELIKLGTKSGPPFLENLSTNRLLDMTYEKARAEMKETINKLKHVTLVADVWGEEVTQRKYVSIWLYSNQLKQILSTRDITSTTSGDQLLQEVDRVREEYCSSSQSYLYLLENDFSPFREQLDGEHMFCAYHELQDIMSEVVNSMLETDDGLNLVQWLNDIKCSQNLLPHPLPEKLSRFNKMNLWYHRLQVLKSILEHWDQLENNDAFKPFADLITRETGQELWEFLSLFLDAFETLSQTTGDGYSSLNLVTLWRAKLEDHCKERVTDSEFLARMRMEGKEALESRALSHPWYLLSVCLDPRFKKLKMLNQNLRESTYASLRSTVFPETEVINSIKRERGCEGEGGGGRGGGRAHEHAKKPKFSDSVTKAFTEYLDNTSTTEHGADEIDNYLNMDPVVGQIQPKEFWEEHGHRFPRLQEIAVKLYSVPAVPSFCHLLSNGNDFPVKRKTVIGKNLDQILFLHTFFSK